jgi:hypothetical protein
VSTEAVGDVDGSSDKSKGNSDGIFASPLVERYEGFCADYFDVGLTVMLAFMLVTTCTPPLTKEVPGADAAEDPMTTSLNLSHSYLLC